MAASGWTDGTDDTPRRRHTLRCLSCNKTESYGASGRQPHTRLVQQVARPTVSHLPPASCEERPRFKESVRMEQPAHKRLRLTATYPLPESKRSNPVQPNIYVTKATPLASINTSPSESGGTSNTPSACTASGQTQDTNRQSRRHRRAATLQPTPSDVSTVSPFSMPQRPEHDTEGRNVNSYFCDIDPELLADGKRREQTADETQPRFSFPVYDDSSTESEHKTEGHNEEKKEDKQEEGEGEGKKEKVEEEEEEGEDEYEEVEEMEEVEEGGWIEDGLVFDKNGQTARDRRHNEMCGTETGHDYLERATPTRSRRRAGKAPSPAAPPAAPIGGPQRDAARSGSSSSSGSWGRRWGRRVSVLLVSTDFEGVNRSSGA
jgi:hypothetical protein